MHTLRNWVRFLTFAALAVLGWRVAAQTASLPARTRAERIRAMESVMGPFPTARGPLDVQVVSETRKDGLVLRDLTYLSQPGTRVPAYLIYSESIATDGKRHPGVLGLHQTHAAGRKVVVGIGNSPDDEYGVELARRGYVVLAPAFVLLYQHIQAAPFILNAVLMVAMLIYAYRNPQLRSANPRPARVDGPDEALV